MDTNVLEMRKENGQKLAIAARENDIESTHLLLSEPDSLDPNIQTHDYGCTALQIACAHGHTEIVRALLANKSVDINVFSESQLNAYEHTESVLEMLSEELESRYNKAEVAYLP
eukprot:197228_1